MTIQFLNAGTAATADGIAPTPSNGVSWVSGDFKVCVFYSRENVDGTVAMIPGGWTEHFNGRDSIGGLLGVWSKFEAGGDAAPTFTLGGHAVGDTCMAQVAAWRGVRSSDRLDAIGGITIDNTAIHIGPIDGITIESNTLVLVIGGKRDDWVSVDTLTGESLPWVEISEIDETAGDDAGLVWNFAINGFGPVVVSDKTFTVVGGSIVGWKGIMISFNPEVSALAGSDLVFYCAESHPKTDAGSPGGAIDLLMRASFTDLAASDDLEAISDDTADTVQSITVRGRDAGGDLVQESKTLNGTTAVILSVLGVIERVEEVILSGPCLGNVTLRRSVAGATVGVIPPGELGFRRIFAYTYASPTATKAYYEKIFLRNNHLSSALISPTVIESADPQGLFTFTLAASKDDSAFATSRVTQPALADTDPDTFDASSKSVPGGSLDPGEGIGIWLKLSAGVGEPVFKDTYSLGVSGSS